MGAHSYKEMKANTEMALGWLETPKGKPAEAILED